ncbi:HAMP domain-containing protein [Nocardioides sp. MAH-18]|uniref:histidine kinase n=1 Tax=Nocardioides agri TaxID=2682843 RepID=A0A6L6XX31_9ACTN|nr:MULTISPECIES: HAMP domain-containing sensor histidine kinase [unclassified Nocardioides]MBA2952617.1 HAMP domain-containing histidine kinase [Nocardioides sp. CGMCC 1.13656]MVQ51779.1 HAMP domain-containing protein [Nocardioides sp. MAH-18]
MTGVRRRVSHLPLRVRLVAGFSAAMLVLLVAAGAFVYWRVEYALDRGLDTELEQATSVITPLVGPDGTVSTPESADATGTGWQVLSEQGEVLDAGGPAPQHPLVSTAQLAQVGDDAHTVDVGTLLPAADQPYRVRITPLSTPAGYLLVGVRRDHRDEALRELLLQLSLAGLGALVAASVVGDLLARAALRPVERYRRRAAEIAAGAADLRLDVPAGRDDEVTRLGHTLNDMLAALEEALDRERRFVDDASHELRTPLTLLKSRIQLARRRHRTVAEHERILDELALDVARLVDLSEQLLAVDRQEPGSDGACDAGDVVRAAAARWRAAAPSRSHELTLELPTGSVPARIGAPALDRVVVNLVGNALTHGAAPVEVRVLSSSGHAVVTVADSGAGMPPELLDQATRRFSRAVEARSRPGAGLGLAIVERLVVAAGGELRLCYGDHHRSIGTATHVPCSHDARMTVTVILPAAGL